MSQQKGMELMNYENLKERTKRFALDIIKLTEELPKDQTCRVLGGQLLRCGTSVGANYRAVCRAKSNADFISKFGTVEEEADESGYWLELLVDSGKLKLKPAAPLLQEADELTAIAVASINTARRRKRGASECGVRNAECGSSEGGQTNAECGTSDCGVGNAECGISANGVDLGAGI